MKNFILHVEWKHLKAGGNSGIFVWSDAVPGNNRLPSSVEVQMLDLEWVELNKKDGISPPIAYVHGELFGVGDVNEVVCIDGVIKLSVNGKFVDGISQSSIKKGYLCLESEGAEIQFRNLTIIELPSSVTSPEQIAAEIQ